jgi:hypothetical protein
MARRRDLRYQGASWRGPLKARASELSMYEPKFMSLSPFNNVI